jgi:hypothetical protein
VTRTSKTIAVLALPVLAAMLAAQDPQPARPTPMRTIQPAGTAATPPAPPSQDELKKRYEDKLTKPFLAAATWTTDYDKARATAKEEGKLLFGYFTRSYAR